MERSIRSLAILGLAIGAIVALPAQALACGIGLSFRETIHHSAIVVIADVEQAAGKKQTLAVERVFKGRPAPTLRINTKEFSVSLRPGNRIALAVMHPEYNDGNGVSAWLIHADGRLSSMGQDGEPRTIDEFTRTFTAPASSTEMSGLTGGSTGLPSGLPLIGFAAIAGGFLGWRRLGGVADRGFAMVVRLRRPRPGRGAPRLSH